MTGADFVLAHLGKPWQSGAAGPEAYDCWGLVRAYYADVLGISLPIVDVDALKPVDVRHEFADKANRHGWLACPSANHAAVLMGKSQRPAHVGIWLDGSVLHCMQGMGVVYQRPLPLKFAGWNVLGHYRRAV